MNRKIAVLMIALFTLVFTLLHDANIAHAESTVARSPDTNYPPQQRVVRVGGYFYVFYVGTDNYLYYKSSVDGVSWSREMVASHAAISQPGAFTVFTDGTYIIIAYPVGTYYLGDSTATTGYTRKGTPSGGTITWDTAVSIRTAAGWWQFSLVKTANRYYLAIRAYWTTTQFYYGIHVYYSTTASSWAEILSVFTLRISVNIEDCGPGMAITRLPGYDDGIMLVYALYNSSNLDYMLYNGSSWSSGQTFGGKTAQKPLTQFSLVTAYGKIHIAYPPSDDGGTLNYQYYDVSWSSIITVDSSTCKSPSFAVHFLGNALFLFYHVANTIYCKIRTSTASTWSNIYSMEDSAGVAAIVSLNYASDMWIGFSWRSGSSSPYNIKFEKIALPLNVAVSNPGDGTSNSIVSVNCTVTYPAGYAYINNVTLQIGTSIMLKWSGSTGFSELSDPYDYCKLISDSCSVTVVNSTTINVAFTFVLSGRLPSGSITLTAQAKSVYGEVGGASTQMPFTVLKPALTAPADGSGPYPINQLIQFQWAVPNGVSQTAFEIQVDDSPTFSSPLHDSGKVNSSSASYSFVIGKSGTWYWRVRVWDQYDVDTGWSEAWRVLVGYAVNLYGPFWDNGTRAVGQSVQVSVYFGPEYETLTFTLSEDMQVLMDAKPLIISYRHASGLTRILYPTGDENTFFIAIPDPTLAAVYAIRIVDYTGRLAQNPYLQVCAYIEETGGFETIICVPAQGQTQFVLEYARFYIIRVLDPGSWCYDHPVITTETNEIQVPIRIQISEETLKLYKYVAVEAFRNGSYIIVSYADNVETNSPAVITIINVGSGAVWSEQRTGAFWQVIYPFASPGSSYKVTVTVNHVKLGQLTFNRYLPAAPQAVGLFEGLSVLGKIELPGGAAFPIGQLIPIFAVLVCAAVFSTKNAHLGALITVLFAGLLYLIGWLEIEPTLITICLGLAIMYLMSKYREER